MAEVGIPLNGATISSVGLAKRYADNKRDVNAIDFSRDGALIVTSSDDESINVYNADSGMSQTKVFNKKYGCSHVRFTRTLNQHVLLASNNDWDYSLRYLNVTENSYLRYYTAHRDRVVALSLNPSDDSIFLSASLDDTVRLWDLRTATCQGWVKRYGHPAAAFDPAGLIFATASANNTVCLYDRRNFDTAPFSTFQLDCPVVAFRSLEFSPDGQAILLLTRNKVAFLLDAFTGELLNEYTSSDDSDIVSVGFSPDGSYVLGGLSTGVIVVWKLRGLAEFVRWHGLSGPVGAVRWSPRHFLIAAADDQLSLWCLQNES